MTMNQLGTIVQEQLEVKIAVVANGYLGMVRQWQEFFYTRRYAATPIVNPDFTRLAEAFGIPAVAVKTRAEVAQAVGAARAHRGPSLIEFRVEQEDSVFPLVPPGAALHEMIRRPKSPIVETGADP
jgi:acetolactate synthase-1/2/3 large subunit